MFGFFKGKEKENKTIEIVEGVMVVNYFLKKLKEDNKKDSIAAKKMRETYRISEDSAIKIAKERYPGEFDHEDIVEGLRSLYYFPKSVRGYSGR